MSNIPANFTDGVFTISDDNSNSEALALSNGDLSFTGLVPDGRALVVSQSRGATTGLRKGARVYPTLTVTAQLAESNSAFNLLALGETSGFTSTSVDIGDYPCVDFDFSFDYGAEVRDLVGDDAALTDFTVTEGETTTVSFSFQIHGPITADSETIVSAR